MIHRDDPALFGFEAVIHDRQTQIDKLNGAVEPLILYRHCANPRAGTARDFDGEKHDLETKWSGQDPHVGQLLRMRPFGQPPGPMDGEIGCLVSFHKTFGHQRYGHVDGGGIGRHDFHAEAKKIIKRAAIQTRRSLSEAWIVIVTVCSTRPEHDDIARLRAVIDFFQRRADVKLGDMLAGFLMPEIEHDAIAHAPLQWPFIDELR